jgi:DNA polymerase-1
LDIPPDEQIELKDWLFANIKGAKQAKKNWGKYICEAPGELVGKYAKGDTDRTKALYDFLYPSAVEYDMLEAYNRELRLTPVIIDMEKNGVRVSPEVHDELAKREHQFELCEKRIFRKVGEVNVGHGATLFKAMQEKGLVDNKKVEFTEKGNPRTGRDFVPLFCKDKRLVKDLELRSRLEKVIGTYLRPWAEAEDQWGRFYPYFKQTRGDTKGGTKTGRLSSNFQQVPKNPEESLGMPYLRNFILPDEKQVLVARDYSSQEIRILAHYAEGSLLQAYQNDPDMDPHNWVKGIIHDVAGLSLDRSHVKQANFLQIYGGGVPALSNNLQCSETLAKQILTAHKKALPEVKGLSKKLESQLKGGVLLRTWGGRLYDVEYGQSKLGQFEYLYYKLINLLIQGSAADQVKELMINYHYHPKRQGRIMLQVHDELINSVPRRNAKTQMSILTELMNDSTDWDVPMRSDGKIGDSWGSAKKVA